MIANPPNPVRDVTFQLLVVTLSIKYKDKI